MFEKVGGISPTTYFRPAISIIYSTIHSIFGINPFFFHLFQLSFHIATAVLIFYLFKRFFKETVALILAIIFLVHPALVEAVSFASAMQESAFTFVGLVGLYLFVIPVKTGIQKQNWIPDQVGDDTKGIIFLLIALLMKETAIVFFPLVFFYILIFIKDKRKILVNYFVLSAILLIGYLLFRFSGGNFYTQGQTGLFPIMRVSLLTRLINIPAIILFYLTKIFYPMNLAIAQHWVIKTISFQNFWLPLMIEIALFIGAVTYSIKTKKKPFLFFFIWFVIGLIPHLQLIPLNMTVAERWLYFPIIGMLGMIGTMLSKLQIINHKSQINFKSQIKSKTVFILLIIIITTFSIRSFIRVQNWRNGLTLFGHDIRANSSFDLNNNYGVELFRIGRYDEAKKYFEKSTKLAPYWWVNWNNLGASFEHEKNYQKAAEYYQKSVSNGQYYLAYENLAKILVLYGKDKKKTKEFLQKALMIFPESQNLQTINQYFLRGNDINYN